MYICMHNYRRVKLSAGLLRATRQRVAFVISHWISLPVAVWLSPVRKIQTESPSKNQCRNYWRGRQDLGAAWEIFFLPKKKKRNIKWGKKEKPKQKERFFGPIFPTPQTPSEQSPWSSADWGSGGGQKPPKDSTSRTWPRPKERVCDLFIRIISR